MILLKLTAAVGLLAAAAPALALSTQHIGTDAEMLALLTDTLFVAEGRIGDGAGAATFEIDLGGDTGAPATTAQYDWPNGGSVAWTLTYDSVSNQITFNVDGIPLMYTSPLSGFTDLFVRTRAVNANSTILVDNMVLDAVSVGAPSFADANASGLDILWISGGILSDGFTLTGHTTMAWTGTRPTQSRLAFQIKVGKILPVPVESSTWGQIKALYK